MLAPSTDWQLNFFHFADKWAGVRFLLFKRTINPTNHIYLGWEFFRCVITVMRMLLIVLYFNVLFLMRPALRIFTFHLFDLFYIVDMFVRLHIQYYNENGILVTHPLYTARHYLKTNFAIDLVSTLPILRTRSHLIFGASYQEIAGLVIVMFARCLQIYRIVGILEFVKSSISLTKANLLEIMKYVAFVVFIMATLANITQMISCTYNYGHKPGTVKATCQNSSWHTAESHKINVNKPQLLILEATFLTVYALTRAGTGSFNTNGEDEIFWFLILFIIGFVMRLCLLMKATSFVVRIPILIFPPPSCRSGFRWGKIPPCSSTRSACPPSTVTCTARTSTRA